MPFANRATAAFLGLALGDAFGAPLEFLRGPLVCSRPVPIESGRFDWTDDTLMAIYLAEAVLAQGPDPLDEDAFGTAVGEAFSRWLDSARAAGSPRSPCRLG
ncbi:MAG: ADP-ribosylglycohydrolase family protein [Chromatiaceae bacterium]|jgi:ADP-ribosylglycohydrolase